MSFVYVSVLSCVLKMSFYNFTLLSKNFSKRIFFQKRYFESIASTIYALSTNIKNSSAIAVIRVSGPNTRHVINEITKGKCDHFLKNPRTAILQNYYDPNTSEIIDKGILLWFPKPKSYTGDDMCELHIHGSQAVISKLLNVLGQFPGCRLAKEGEFTKQALTNGKLQLIQVEGIRDLINAKTESQRRRALSVLSGSLDSKFCQWREQLIKSLAHLEAYIDFSEDELIEEKVLENLKINIEILIKNIEDHLEKTMHKSELIKDGLKIAIVGEANVGKSSLINRLSEKEVSIISPISGTTRDIVETWIDIDGYCVCIADTAGIKDLQNSNIDCVERQGIQKAIQRAKQCHFIILVLDSKNVLKNKTFRLPHYIEEIVRDFGNDFLLVVNKIDLITANERKEIEEKLQSYNGKINYLSCVNNIGINDFLNVLSEKINSTCDDSNSELLFTNERHIVHLKETVKELEKVNSSIELDLAVAALHLRQASYHLGCLVGNVTLEDVLDKVFKDFCIGK